MYFDVGGCRRLASAGWHGRVGSRALEPRFSAAGNGCKLKIESESKGETVVEEKDEKVRMGASKKKKGKLIIR